LSVSTRYPDDGEIRLGYDGPAPLRLAVRIPSWSSSSLLDGGPVQPDDDGYLRIELSGSRTLTLDLTPRWTQAHHRVDALRGARAIEVGPRVYCVEQVDLPDGVALDDVIVADGAPLTIRPDSGSPKVSLQGTVRSPSSAGLYASPEHPPESGSGDRTIDVVAIPFASWGNRGSTAMRVWLPVT
jgi:DUF1680 family protein